MKEIILVGNGWAGSSFLKYIDNNKYKITVVSSNKNFTYTPLLISSIFNNIDIFYNIKNFGKIKYIRDNVKDINFNDNCILLNNLDKQINYDYLILAHGSENNTFDIEGVENNCNFINHYNIKIIKDKLNKLENKSNVVVIGCGLTGSELIGNLIDQKKYTIHAFDGYKYPLYTFNENISTYTYNHWKYNNVNTYFNKFVKKIDSNKIYYDNKFINYDMIFWCCGIKSHILSKQINNKLSLNCNYGIPVSSVLKVKNTNNVFAIGDCKYNKYNKYPKTAQVAYQEGKYLATHFNNNFQNMNPFNFYDKGQICYIGVGKSIYQNKYFESRGKLTNYFYNFIHIYNGINFDQKIQIGKDLFKF